METATNAKAQLIAIYRLEFYKKQNHWKINKDAKHKNDKLKNNRIVLNKTYVVDEPKTQSGLLNEAFVDTDSDKSNAQSTSPSTKTECLDNYPHEALPQLQNEHSTEPKQWIHPVLKPQETEFENAWNSECLIAERDLIEPHNYPGDRENGYWLESNENWIQATTLEQLWSKEASEALTELDCGDNAENVLCCAENWLQREEQECLWTPNVSDRHCTNENAISDVECCVENESEISTDSWLSFKRGAEIAAHSSKIELTLPNALGEIEVSGDTLASLSSTQLKEAVRTHSLLLRRLLKEDTQRRRIRSCLSLTGGSVDRPSFTSRPATDFCSYDYQRCDFDPFYRYNKIGNAVRSLPQHLEDVFLAGSHRNADLEVLGRGRGRLQSYDTLDTRNRIVGIEKGRPFRFT